MSRKLNKKFNNSCWRLFMLSMAVTGAFAMLVSCNNGKGKTGESLFVINEIMPANHTGLCAQDGELYDWIEVKNTSDEVASLGDFSLMVSDKAGKAKKKKNPKKKQWQFPDIEVKPGECVLVFASKKDDSNSSKELHASFKLPADGATVKLLDGDEVIDEVKYPKLDDDQCYRRVADTTFEISYEQTPGFPNDRKGYEKFNSAVDKQRQGPLRLWELLSKPEGDDAKSWVEIKNVSGNAVNLKDYCLTTSLKEMTKWQLPDVQLQPGAIFVVESDDAKLKIGAGKEVMLTRNGKFVDGISPQMAPLGVSVGRCDGYDGMFFFASPTRGVENTTQHMRFMAQKPTFALKPGVYSGKNEMKIALNTHGSTVHYTLDGTRPDASSPVFKEPIKITKTTTVRAFCAGDSVTLSSHVATGTYIFDEPHTIAVINVTVDSTDLYDLNRGIYVEGPNADDEVPHVGANYWNKWWKMAHVEFFDGKEGFSEDCQLAIFGGYSRMRDKKSFKIRFKNTDGPSHIFYDLFDVGKSEKFKKIVLRSGSQDDNGVMARDEFFTSLMKENSPTMLVQDYRPVALYINGGYFGLYYIREKIDEHFAARHLNVSNDSVIVRNGSDDPEILNFATSHNLADPKNYEWLKERYDLMSLADQRIGEIYSCNTDVANVRYVYSPDPAGDRKWHVVFHDLDWAWVLKTSPSLYLKTGSQGEKRNICNRLINAVMKNKEFRSLFLERLSLHLHKTLTPKNTAAVFDKLINTIRPEMKRNCKRWPKMTYEKWEKNVAAFRANFNTRNKTMLNELRAELSITPEEEKKYFADLGY